MPELPEVETVLQGLKANIADKTKVEKIIIRFPKLRWDIPGQDLNNNIIDQKILNISRRGKYLLFKFKTGTMLIHLGMSGVLKLQPLSNGKISEPLKHDHVDIILNNNSFLRLNDPRRFGALLWAKGDVFQYKLLHHLGPEPLSSDFNFEYLKNKLNNKNIGIKKFIMDSKNVVGAGNIYAQESLFLSKIHPEKLAKNLSDFEIKDLIKNIKLILKKAIKAGGTTLKDYKNSEGKPGYFQQELLVYGRANQKCVICENILKELKIAGRTTVYCSNCQNDDKNSSCKKSIKSI